MNITRIATAFAPFGIAAGVIVIVDIPTNLRIIAIAPFVDPRAVIVRPI